MGWRLPGSDVVSRWLEVWFALPTDAAHSLLMGEEEPHLAEGSIFTKARGPCSVQLSAAMDGICFSFLSMSMSP